MVGGGGGGVTGTLGQISITMSVVDRASKRFSNIDAAMENLSERSVKLSQGFRQLGSAMTAGGALISGSLNSIDQNIRQYEASLARASALTVQSKTDMEDFATMAERMGHELGISSENAAQGLYYVASTGEDSGKVLDQVARSAGKVTQIFGTDMQSTARTAVVATRVFRDSLTEVDEVMGVLNYTSSKSMMNFQDMMNTMRYAGPVFKASGMDLKDFASGVSALADAGISGSRAGTSLRAAITRLLEPVGRAEEEMDKLNVELFESTEESLRYEEELEKVEEQLTNTQSEISKTKNRIDTLSDAMSDYSITSRKAMLQVRKIRHEAEREDRDLTQSELDRIEQLKEASESLQIRREQLAISQKELNSKRQESEKSLENLKNQQKELEQNIEESKGSFKGFPEVIAQLGVAMSDYGQKAKSAALQNIFGRRAASGMMMLFSQMSDKVDNATGKYGKSEEAVKSLTKSSGEYTTGLAQMKNELENTENVMSFMNAQMDNVVQNATHTVAANRAQATEFEHLSGTIGDAQSAIVKYKETQAKVKGSIYSTAEALGLLSGGVGKLAVGLSIIGPVLAFTSQIILSTAVAVQILSASTALLLGKFALLGGGFSLIVYGFYKAITGSEKLGVALSVLGGIIVGLYTYYKILAIQASYANLAMAGIAAVGVAASIIAAFISIRSELNKTTEAYREQEQAANDLHKAANKNLAGETGLVEANSQAEKLESTVNSIGDRITDLTGFGFSEGESAATTLTSGQTKEENTYNINMNVSKLPSDTDESKLAEEISKKLGIEIGRVKTY